jgi:hypothetical protein
MAWKALGLSLAVQPGLGAAEPPAEVAVETKLVASDGAEGDNFGAAVAVSGDVLVACAPWADVEGRETSGAVYLFRRDPATNQWVEQKRVMPDDGDYGSIEMRVAVDGDTIVVGAPYATLNEFQQGAVHIFGRHHGGPDNWGQVAKLSDDAVGSGGHFGSSVAIQGDLLVVGASEGSARHGWVRLYERHRGGVDHWGEVTTLSYSAVGDAGNVVSFGSAVALSGDRLLVGAANTSVSYSGEADGAGYLFRRDPADPDHWEYLARLITPGADECVGGRLVSEIWLESVEWREEAHRCATEDSETDNDDFGYAVALDGEIAVVGARFAEGADGSYSVGAAYVYQPDPSGGDQWSFVARLTPGEAVGVEYFGSAMALAADTVLVGAKGTSIDSRDDQGAAYVFQRDLAGSWSEAQTLTASDGLSQDYFGVAVALLGPARFVGAYGQQGWRGTVYVHEPSEPDVPVVECQPAFPATDTLQSATEVISSAGVILAAGPGALAEPLPVWIHEVDPPAEPLFSGVTPLGAYHSIGAQCTTFAPPRTPFVVGLPVPESAETSRLAVAVLVPASSIVGGPLSGGVWEVVIGEYDPTRRLYSVRLHGLAVEGSTFVLIESPSFEAGSPETDGARSAPRFDVRCLFWQQPGTCGRQDERDAADALAEAYRRFTQQGFPEPALNMQGPLASDQASHAFIVRPARRFSLGCDGNVEDGYYNRFTGNIVFCGVLPPDRLSSVTRHEIFHAIQNAYPDVRRQTTDDWVIEGTASAAEAATLDGVMHRTPARSLRQVDVTLTRPRPTRVRVRPYPYEAQDFWVYLFRSPNAAGVPRDLPLRELGSFFDRGASTASVADRLQNPPGMTFRPLGDEYWAWVKNQVVEKTDVTFDGALANRCQIQASVVANPLLFSYAAASDHIYGHFDSGLDARVVIIEFPGTEAPDGQGGIEMRGLANATILAEGGGDGLAYKVYRENDALDCQTDVQDGERVFAELEPGAIVYVVLANKAYGSDVAPPLFKVTVRVAE